MDRDHGDGAFNDLATRLARAAVLLAVLALAGAVIEALRNGLTFGLLVRWGAGYIAVLLIAAALLVAVHAAARMRAAQRRGERLSGEDVGLLPPRKEPE